MSINGMETGNGATAPKRENSLVDVKISEGDDFAPGFSLAQVAPRIPAKQVKGEPLLDGRSVPAHFKESFRELRFAIEQARERSGVRTIGIVSLDDGDGKSLTAANLALALTEGGSRRVALLDACYGAPRIAKLLAAEAPVGLAEVLSQKMSAERAMFAAGPDGLFAMSTGDAAGAGVDPIDTAEQFGMLANRLATVFDYVIVDTPALSKKVDAAAIANRLDGVILVVRARKTKASEIDRAIARLGESRVLGLVLNQV